MLLVTPQVAHFSDASQRSSFDVAIENVRLAAGDAEKITLELIMLSAEHGHGERPPPGDQFPRKEGALVVPTDGSPAQEGSLVGAEVDFFYLDGEACCSDVDRTVAMLREQTCGEEILGAVMFSCLGRGPMRGGLIGEDMADATRFANAFPDVPCLGYYAGGEIGPTALAGNRNVFRQGRAAVQGFTAVFCLFIVPVVERRDYALDDSPDAVRAFVDERLSTR